MPENLLAILMFNAGYNTALVMASTVALGFAAGIVGMFLVLRKRALISDTVSHATLPGIGLGFLFSLYLGIEDGRFLPLLLAGAGLTGLLGGLCTHWIAARTRLGEDAAMASVLGVFYGAGIVLLSYIQHLDAGSKAGLDSFLLGQVSGLSLFESRIIAGVSALAVAASFLFSRPLAQFCFDREFSHARGLPLFALDMLLFLLMLVIVCVGLKTVGLILILALLIIPPVSARFWSARLLPLSLLSGCFGALSCYIGGALSAAFTDLPTGGMIVLIAFSVFTASFLCAPHRGFLKHLIERRRLGHGTV